MRKVLHRECDVRDWVWRLRPAWLFGEQPVNYSQGLFCNYLDSLGKIAFILHIIAHFPISCISRSSTLIRELSLFGQTSFRFIRYVNCQSLRSMWLSPWPKVTHESAACKNQTMHLCMNDDENKKQRRAPYLRMGPLHLYLSTTNLCHLGLTAFLSRTLSHLSSLSLQSANTLLAPLPSHLRLGFLPRIGLVRHFSYY